MVSLQRRHRQIPQLESVLRSSLNISAPFFRRHRKVDSEERPQPAVAKLVETVAAVHRSTAEIFFQAVAAVGLKYVSTQVQNPQEQSPSRGPPSGSTAEPVGLSGIHVKTWGSIFLRDDNEAHLTADPPPKQHTSVSYMHPILWQHLIRLIKSVWVHSHCPYRHSKHFRSADLRRVARSCRRPGADCVNCGQCGNVMVVKTPDMVTVCEPCRHS